MYLSAECGCDGVGSNSSECNVTTGQCVCNNHVTGRSCDRCDDNYVDLSVGGCTGTIFSLLLSFCLAFYQMKISGA